MQTDHPSVTPLRRERPPTRLLKNLACDVSGLLFDLNFRDDLAPFLSWHPRLHQIQNYPPLLVYADPRHCTADRLTRHVADSIHAYPQLALSAWDQQKTLAPYISGPGFRGNRAGTEEAHRLVLFSSAAPSDPLGLLWLKRGLTKEHAEEATHIYLEFRLPMAYIRPEYRGLGYGTVLAVAAAMCCSWEIRHQAQHMGATPPAQLSNYLHVKLKSSPEECSSLLATFSAKLRSRLQEDEKIMANFGVHIATGDDG